jgi:hypothetical protein
VTCEPGKVIKAHQKYIRPNRASFYILYMWISDPYPGYNMI